VRFGFRELPDPGHPEGVRARPIVDIVVDGLEHAPQAALLDSGATSIRFGVYLAELCGIDLSDAPKARLAVGGGLVTARMAEVDLMVADHRDCHRWTAPVWFCDPWTPAFGLLGLTGFFDQFDVTTSSYEERIELTPVSP